MSKSIKLEKVTVWTSIPLYGAKDTTISALDYILREIDSECVILDYDVEDLDLVKRVEVQPVEPAEGVQLKLF